MLRNKETNFLLGARHVTTAKVLTTSSLNGKHIHALNQSNDNGEDSDDQWFKAVNNGTDSVTATLTLNDISCQIPT